MPSLPPEVESFLRRKVESGMYDSADEVIEEALRLLEERDKLREIRLEELRALIRVGIEQADRGELLDEAEVFGPIREKLRKRMESGS